MTSVPRLVLDRSRPIFRDDPVISRLTDEQVWAFAEVLVRLARTMAQRLEEECVATVDIETHGLETARTMAAERRAAGNDVSTAPSTPVKKRARRTSPKRLAKWEAQWQAEQTDEGQP